MPSETSFRIVNISDKNQIFLQCAKLHTAVISEGFLPKLGANFLTLLYSAFAESKSSFLVIASSNNEIIGFIAISTDTKEFYKWFIKKKAFYSFLRINHKLLSPHILKKVFETLRYPFRSKVTYPYISSAEIFNFCVSENSQGKGTGKKLFRVAINHLEALGVSKLKIVTGANQISAQNFYQSVGAQLEYKFEIHEDQESLVYSFFVK